MLQHLWHVTPLATNLRQQSAMSCMYIDGAACITDSVRWLIQAAILEVTADDDTLDLVHYPNPSCLADVNVIQHIITSRW
jgi:hypothetical protein